MDTGQLVTDHGDLAFKTDEYAMKDAIAAGRRVYSLDVLRGLAACLVLFQHLPPTQLKSETVVEPLIWWLSHIGGTGVDLFFVLSGLLISSLIYREFDREGAFRPCRFLIRRSFKIWPSYFAAYGIVTFLRWLLSSYRGESAKALQISRDAIWNGLFLQNYVNCEAWTHSWTLAVEEHFYVGLAIILFGATRLLRKRGSGERVFAWIPFAWIAVAIAVSISRYSESHPVAHWHQSRLQTHNRIDELLLGVLLGYFAWYRPRVIQAISANPLVVAGAAMLALVWPTVNAFEESTLFPTIGILQTYICIGIVVAAAASAPEAGSRGIGLVRFGGGFLAWVGIYSYTIYLAHSILFMCPGTERLRRLILDRIQPLLGEGATLWLDRIAFIAASIVLGVVMSHVVERPFLRIRSRLYRAPSSS